MLFGPPSSIARQRWTKRQIAPTIHGRNLVYAAEDAIITGSFKGMVCAVRVGVEVAYHQHIKKYSSSHYYHYSIINNINKKRSSSIIFSKFLLIIIMDLKKTLLLYFYYYFAVMERGSEIFLLYSNNKTNFASFSCVLVYYQHW